MYKYTNYNIKEIYINRLSNYNTDFHSNELLEKYFHFRKVLRHLGKTLLSHPVEVTASMNFGNIFRIMHLKFLKNMFKNLKEIVII